MKTPIKYLLLAAMAGFFFLNISGKEDKKQEQPTQPQTAQRMPQIPNGDFEDQPNKAWKLILDDGSESGQRRWKYQRTEEYQRKIESEKYIINRDSVNAYHGKYCAILMSNRDSYSNTLLVNKFAISFHPNSLNGFIRSILNRKFDKIRIIVNLFSAGSIVDSGSWTDTTTIKQWTEISIPITHASTKIDSATIAIVSSFNPQKDYVTPAEFKVDDLFFK